MRASFRWLTTGDGDTKEKPCCCRTSQTEFSSPQNTGDGGVGRIPTSPLSKQPGGAEERGPGLFQSPGTPRGSPQPAWLQSKKASDSIIQLGETAPRLEGDDTCRGSAWWRGSTRSGEDRAGRHQPAWGFISTHKNFNYSVKAFAKHGR